MNLALIFYSAYVGYIGSHKIILARSEERQGGEEEDSLF